MGNRNQKFQERDQHRRKQKNVCGFDNDEVS